MNRTWKVVAIVAAVVAGLSLAGAAVAYVGARTTTATTVTGFGWMMGQGNRGRQGAVPGFPRGMMGVAPGTAYGPLQEHMLSALAQGLGISEDDLKSRLSQGETPWSIAQGKGLTQEQFTTVWQQALKSAVDAAVTDGTLTRQQGDLLLRQLQAMGPFAGWGGGFGGRFRTAPRGQTQPWW
jgi:hypothetical protein